MEKRELAIITLKKEAGVIYSEQIRYFLGDSIKINLYSFEENNLDLVYEKLIVLSVKLKYEEISEICAKDAQIIIPNLTFEKSSVKKMSKLDERKKIFVYNLSKSMALETITIIHKLGINIQNFVPSYPGVNNISPGSVVISPGEEVLVDCQNCEVINIGYRVIDLGCIADIAINLDLKHLIKEDLLNKFIDKVVPTSYTTENLLLSQTKLENKFDFLLASIDEGLVCISEDKNVQFYSHVAKEILGVNDDEMIGKNIGDYIKSFNFSKLKKESHNINKVVKVKNIDINIDIRYTEIYGFRGFIIKLAKFYESEKRQAKLRAQLMNSGNVSKYNFDDIIGCSKSITESKRVAYKMAQSNSSILIIGESGTGKELFAQSIHSVSYRNKGPFVAVNCSTFQEGILQSELFGYEEGAFTGAKKGGKIGFFEMANSGTIFLDEIGEMDLSCQASLLRVIQERQIRRVGSDRVVDVDIRIVAATNRDLNKLVCEGKFRKDLFYRLNVLPLKISPLREREDDLFLIFESFKKNLDANFVLSDEVVEVFRRYRWDGNIRELSNVAEYFSYIGKETIELSDLHEYIIESLGKEEFCESIDKEEKSYNEIKFKRQISDYAFVLNKMYEAYNLKQRIGRKKIYEYALEEQIFLTEQQIRSILLELQDYEFVKVLSGRGGSIITEKGVLFLKSI